MATALANSASADRQDHRGEVYFGTGEPDPALLAFDPAASPWLIPAAQADLPGAPVERRPSRPAVARTAVSYPFPAVARPGTAIGLHAAIARRPVGSVGPDQQPPTPVFRRVARNAPTEAWDASTVIEAGQVGALLPAPSTTRFG